MPDTQNITRLEELFLNTWPSIETKMFDGWIMRFAEGYTKRSNSVSPLYPNMIPIDEKIELCEKSYASKNLPLIFKMTEASQPSDLDEYLESSGYGKIDVTSVMSIDLNEYDFGISENVLFSRNITVKWMDAFCAFTGLSEKQRRVFGTLMQMNGENNLYTLIYDNDDIAGCGLGILKESISGIFNVIVRDDLRGNGFGKSLVSSMLSKVKSSGCDKTFLQVLDANESAKKLYSGIGFEEIYKYWYRKK